MSTRALKNALGVVGVCALVAGCLIWFGDGSGGNMTVTTSTGPSVTRTTTTAGTTVVTSTPGATIATTKPGRPARSAESALEIFLLGLFLVLVSVALSKGPITFTVPGGGSVQIGTTAQAQVTGAIAPHYTDPEKAEAAYNQAIAVLKKSSQPAHVDRLSDSQLDELMSDVTRVIPPS